MTQKFECKFYLSIDENGGFVVDKDAGETLNGLTYLDGETGRFAQTYEVTLKVPRAKPLVIEAEIPEIEGAVAVELEVKAE